MFVALGPRKDKDVLAASPDAGVALKVARKKGVETPALISVPKDGTIYVY